MENGPFEDVFPNTKGDIPASYASLPEGILFGGYEKCTCADCVDLSFFLAMLSTKFDFTSVSVSCSMKGCPPQGLTSPLKSYHPNRKIVLQPSLAGA